MAAITPFDLPNALAAHYQLAQQQRNIDSQNALSDGVQQLATNPQNAFATVAATGNADAVAKFLPILQTYTAQQKAQVADRSEALGTLAHTLRTQYPDSLPGAVQIRQAVAMSQLPTLAQHGVTADQLKNYDYSSPNLQTTENQMLGLQGMIAQEDKARTATDTESKNTADAAYQQGELKIGGQKNAIEAAALHKPEVVPYGSTLVDPQTHQAVYSGAGATSNIDDPVIHSHVQNILSGNETMANVPAPMRNTVSMALQATPTASYAPLAAQRNTTAASKIVANYIKLPQYELTANGLPYLQRIDAAMKTPGSVSDQDLLDSLTKLNTAGNAVTDAQVKVITGGKSLTDWAETIGNKFQNGGVLSDNQRQQIKEIANNIYANYKKGYQPVYDQATSQLKASGIPEAFWTIPDLNKLNAGQQVGSAAPAAPATGWSNFKVHN